MVYLICVYDISNWKGYESMALMLDVDRQMVKMEVRTKCMMKYLILILTLVSPTAKAQVSDGEVTYHSLTPSGGSLIGPPPPVPVYSWDRPTWSQGSIGMNVGGSGTSGAGFGGAGSVSPRGIIDTWDLE
jgi:hypothetical protein